jgi:RNA polymerase sigma factor (sigma-70 family)
MARATAPAQAVAPDDPAEFEDWLRPQLASVWLFVCRFSTPESREDVYQNTLLAAWRKRDTYDASRSNPRTWLLLLAADQCRKSRRHLLRPMVGSLAAADDPDPDTAIDVRRAIARLAQRQRVAVELFYVMDLPVSECAQLMGCSVGTVKSTLSDARRALRRTLETKP